MWSRRPSGRLGASASPILISNTSYRCIRDHNRATGPVNGLACHQDVGATTERPNGTTARRLVGHSSRRTVRHQAPRLPGAVSAPPAEPLVRGVSHRLSLQGQTGDLSESNPAISLGVPVTRRRGCMR
jgi:hypothetical protein